MPDLVASLSKERIAVIVAHQDDESLWFGGLLSSLPVGTVAHLINVCAPTPGRPDTHTRDAAFDRVATRLGAHPHHLSLPNVRANQDAEAEGLVPEVTAAIGKFLDSVLVTAVLSHGAHGEPCRVYKNGHAMHKAVSAACNHVCAVRGISWVFGCRGLPDTIGAVVKYDSAKKKILLDEYLPQWSPKGYPAYNEERYCVSWG